MKVFTFFAKDLSINKIVMKRFTTFSILIALLLPFVFSACSQKEEDNNGNPIPESGIYFKMKRGNNIWEGANITEMYVKTEPDNANYKMLDFTVCTDDQTNSNLATIGQWLYLHVQVNEDGSFSNYSVKYAKNKTTTYPIHFDEYMEYKSGTLTVIYKDENKITARFEGVLHPVNGYAEDQHVVIYFQEFPLSRAKKK